MQKSNDTGKIDDTTRAAKTTKGQGEAPTGSHDRLSQGFELIFGEVLERHRDAMTRIEAETADRLEYLERDAGHKAEILAVLQDKAAATLEREDGERRRRRAVEGELREGFAKLAATVTAGLEELRRRSDELEQSTARELASQRESGGENERRGLEQLLKAVEHLAATKLDRADLASLLASLAHEVAAAHGAGPATPPH